VAPFVFVAVKAIGERIRGDGAAPAQEARLRVDYPLFFHLPG
jgi:hypothetical protein